MFEQIKFIAEKRGETASDTIRYLIARGLDERVYQQNTQLIADVVKEEIKQVMKLYGFPTYPSDIFPQKEDKEIDARGLRLCRKTS